MSNDFEMEVVKTDKLQAGNSTSTTQRDGTAEQNGSVSEETPSAKLWPAVPKGWKMVNGSEMYDANPTSYSAEGEVDYIEMDALDTDLPDPKYVGRRDPSKYSGQLFSEGDTLFAQITPCTENGKVALAPKLQSEVGIGSTEFIVLSPDRSRVLPRYLYYLSKSHPVHNYAVSRMRGSTGRQRVPVDVFRKELQIPLPPLPEQRKIASVLYAVDQAIQKTEEIIEQAKRVKKGALQQVLTKGIGHSDFRRVHLGPKSFTVPQSWECPPLEKITYKITDGAHITPDYVEEGVPFLSTKNVDPFEETFDFSGYERYVTEEDHLKLNEKCDPERGDVLICRRATIGPAQLVRTDEPFSIFVGLGMIKPRDCVMGEYLEQFFNWSPIIKMLNVKSPGSTMKTLNLSTLRKQRIPLPPLSEQEEIVKILSAVDNKVSNERKSRRRHDSFKKGLMQDLLTGEVRTADKAIDVLDEVVAHG